MAQQVQFTCDVCGKVKGESNHWFLFVSPVSRTQDNGYGFQVEPFEYHGPIGTQHICSPGCLHKHIDQTISGWRQA
jgi:hypothetical protein